MRTSNNATDRRHAPWRKYARLAWVGVILWFPWFCYTRVTTPPAAAERDDPERRDASVVLSRAAEIELNSLPLLPNVFNTSTPWVPWGTWGDDAEALAKPWKPDSDTTQQQLAAHVLGPAGAQLDLIVELARRDRLVVDRRGGNAGDAALVSVTSNPFGFMQAIASLVVRARHRRIVQGEAVIAMHDLQTALELARVYRQVTGNYGWMESKPVDLARYELARAVYESPLPPDAARGMITYLRQRWGLELRDHLGMVFAGANSVDAMLDRYYTDNGRGNGWLVLSAMTDVTFVGFWQVQPPRSRGWNVFSPLFHDRATMRARLTGIDELLRKAEDSDYLEAIGLIRGQSSANSVNATPRDGPFANVARGIAPHDLDQAYHNLIATRVLAVQFALAAYRFDHATYPASLDLLVPDYLAEPLVDPFTNGSYEYQRTAPDHYTLGPSQELPQALLDHLSAETFGYNATSYLPALPISDDANE